MVDLTTVRPLPEGDVWPATIPTIENGWRVTAGDIDIPADSGIANWQARELATRTAILKSRVDGLLLTGASLTTVGPGGDYATINAALSVLSQRGPSYAPGGFSTELRLLAGYTMAEQVLVSGLNLGWLTLTSEATEVVIVRGALATQFGSCFPAFGALHGGTLPRIEALFVMDGTGSAVDRNGVYVANNGNASVGAAAGVRTAGQHGIRTETGGQVSANGSNFSGALGSCVYATGGTRVAVQTANLSNAGDAALFATNGAVVHADQCAATGANNYGVRSVRGATVNAYLVNARRNGPAGADTTSDLSIQDGGTIVATGATGGVSTPVNTLSANGVIYR